MKFFVALISVLCFSFKVKGQDTITVMTYNLLFYGGTGHSSLAPSNKNTHLKKIINYVLPDLLGVNELANNAAYADNVLFNVLNQNGRNYYKRAAYSNVTNSTLTNMLYYNSQKLELLAQYFINGGIRDMLLYKLYYKTGSPIPPTDTTFLFVVVTHLRADASQTAARAIETDSIMNYLNNFPLPNNPSIILMGDLNLYTSSEVAYQNLTNHSNPNIRFYDPINRPGGWSNDISFQDIHTQSTRVNSEADGGSDGGLDDRFDFILMNNQLLNNANAKLQYLPNSYKAFGNPGNLFNDRINNNNSSVPDSIANALYAMSDHLPVIAKIKTNFTSNATLTQTTFEYTLNTSHQEAHLTFNTPYTGSITLYNLLGQPIFSYSARQETNLIIHLPDLPQGAYLLSFQSNSAFATRKFWLP